MKLREIKQSLRNWIKRFDEQRLADVYAFNQDQRMEYSDPCCCIMGVTLAKAMHASVTKNFDRICPESGKSLMYELSGKGHYDKAGNIKGSEDAELAYFYLGFPKGEPGQLGGQASHLRRVRFSAILRGEMRQRDRAKAQAIPTLFIDYRNAELQ